MIYDRDSFTSARQYCFNIENDYLKALREQYSAGLQDLVKGLPEPPL